MPGCPPLCLGAKQCAALALFSLADLFLEHCATSLANEVTYDSLASSNSILPAQILMPSQVHLESRKLNCCFRISINEIQNNASNSNL